MFAVMSWVLASTARAGRWGAFGLNLGAILFALLAGLLSNLLTSKTRKLIIKNMTRDERTGLARIGEQAGRSLGLRVAPFALLLPIFSMSFGMASLMYTVPPSVMLLVFLCLPVWRATRKQTNATLLATAFARENGIKTLNGKGSQSRHAIS